MARENVLSVLDIARELNTGKATIKFLLKRFKKWLPWETVDGQAFYPPETIQKLFLIQENLESGLVPSDIEKNLDNLSSSDPRELLNQFSSDANKDIRLSKDGLSLLKSLFQDIGEQQKRIAAAHEKRAEAEERKAAAIEKRAGAEEKKADAMNNIAAALQEMNQLRGNDPGTRQIALEAASVIAADESDPIDSDPLDSDPLESDPDEPGRPASGAPGLPAEDSVGSMEGTEILDETDLSSLLDEDSLEESFAGFDNLSDLLEERTIENSEPDDLDNLDDLDDLDDLASLLDTPEPDEDDIPGEDDDLDDLSALIDTPRSEPKAIKSDDLDDLSALIDIASNPGQAVDDLSALINDISDPGPTMDDLSALIADVSEPDPAGNDPDGNNLDDLSQLIDAPKTIPKTRTADSFDEKEGNSKDSPVLKIDISPEKNLEKYKAAVMKIIIQLKSDGLSVEETTGRLNRDKIRTLSGKPEWNQRAISQIYKFIDSAA